MSVDDVFSSASKAVSIFRIGKEGKPDLVDLGLPDIHDTIGGVFPGNLVAIAAGQNVGKSSIALSMLLRTSQRGGYISLEDGEDVVGARLLASASGVGPTRIRRKDLSEADLVALDYAQRRFEAMAAEGLGPRFAYRIGAKIDEVEEAVHVLAAEGCRFAVLDYLQKVRGHHAERRCEVGETMVRFQRACAKQAMVPVILSQLVRMQPGYEPFPHHMKESGDIENECRLIVMFWKDSDQPALVHGKVAKSSFGGGGLRLKYMYNYAEALLPEREWPAHEEEW